MSCMSLPSFSPLSSSSAAVRGMPTCSAASAVDGGFFAQANFAVVFAGLQSAQALAGHEGEVNDLVLALRPGFTEADAVGCQRHGLEAGRAEAVDGLRRAVVALVKNVTTKII